MANDLRTDFEPSMSSLVSGIISDVQDLLKQQLVLFQKEIQSDLRKTREAALSMLLGAGVAAIAAVLLAFTVVYLLEWATRLPLWGCFGIVGLGLAIVGGVLTYGGLKKFESFNPLPDESAQALKENVQCLMNPK